MGSAIWGSSRGNDFVYHSCHELRLIGRYLGEQNGKFALSSALYKPIDIDASNLEEAKAAALVLAKLMK